MFSRHLMVLILCGAILPTIDATSIQMDKPTLEYAFKQWRNGLASTDKKIRERALRAMLPNQKDVRFLFPKHAAKLWPFMEKGNQIFLNNVDQIAKELTRGGDLKGVRLFDMRKEKNASAGYKRLFQIIPKDVPVFELQTETRDGSGGRGLSHVYVHNRWLWIQEFEEYPKALEKLN